MAANRVFSGHCRIEAIAGDGQVLHLFEGLRLHLDVQLEPEGTATAPMPVGTFSGRPQDATATERAAPRRAPVTASATPAYQQWMVLTALASLLLALASWWVGGEPAQPTAEPTDLSSNMSSEPEPAAASAAPPSVTPAVMAAPPAADPAVVVVPLPAPAPAAAAPEPAPARPAANATAGTPHPPSAPGPRQRPPASGAAQHAAVAAERGRAPRATADGEEARAAAPRLANTDLLYLFGDTK